MTYLRQTDEQREAIRANYEAGRFGNRSQTNAGIKYKPNEADKELIGIQDAILFWATRSGIDNSTDDAGNSGLHLSIFDTTSRADAAQIKLLNDSGDTQYVVAAVIKAKPVVRLSGEQGFSHDAFVDYQDIFLSGENLFEFGNNFVVTKAQLEQLADYYAKALGVIVGDSAAIRTKHIYSVTIPGRCWWFEPGEWYTLQVGGVGQREYIDSVCECYGVQVGASADGLGTTRVDFREVEQNWVKDSNAVARFLATGDPRWKPNNFGRVVVAARDYMGTADYYCDGTADQVEIQAAIDHLANAFGGGLVELTEGQYNITAAIDLSYDDIIFSGAGARTIISKNGNVPGIKILGTSSIYISNVNIQNLLITGIDAEDQALIDIQYAQRITVNNCFAKSCHYYGIYLNYCDDSTIANTRVWNCNNDGIFVAANGKYIFVIGCQIYDNGRRGVTIVGGDYCSVINNSIHDNLYMAVYVSDTSTNCIVDNNNFENNISNTLETFGGVNRETVPDAYLWSGGIHVVSGASKVSIKNNNGKNNGNFMRNANCEFATSPAGGDEVANTLTQCTYARSDVQKYAGTYSYLLTKTVAAGTAATAYLTDNANTNDLHGLYAGQQYRFGCWVYIPSGAMLGSELSLVIRDYVAAWEEQAQACALTYDAWQYVEVTKTLRAGSIGATFGFSVASAAALNETAYTDNLRLTPMGTGNLHNQNFYDAGTNTYTGV